MELYRFYPGVYPIVINVPHAGTQLAPTMRNDMTSDSTTLPDTDWFVDRLYQFARDMHLHLLVAQNSRTVVDLNRNRQPEELYPGAFSTGVVPLQNFDKSPIYKKDHEPNSKEQQERISAYWQPYHNKLLKILTFCIERHGKVVLLDAHSIRSHVPTLFDGELPALNFGTGGGTSCDADLANKLFSIASASSYSAVMDDRFKGGYITRHYGKPDAGCHAIQLEMAQRCYMREDRPYEYLPEEAAKVQREVLRPMLEALVDWVS